MTRKVFLSIFILLIALNWANASLSRLSIRTPRYQEINNSIEEDNIKSKETINDDTKKISANVSILSDKKILKKEISKRKKYHKNLIYMYNKNFDNESLELITRNWLLLTNLDRYYKSNFMNNERTI